MAPKKDINPSEDENNYWRKQIEETQLVDGNWNVKVVIIEPAGSDHDRIYLNNFESFAAEGKRFVIKNICKTETIFMINQLGGEKKVKNENLRVFEECQSFLKDHKEIPPDVLALIIKHLILKMKEEYLFIKRQKLEVNAGMKRESATMTNKVEVKSTISDKPHQPPEPNSTPPKWKGKNTIDNIPELTEGKKYNTFLRLRGEEWRDKVYVDDFPTDGPNLYVAITGFVEPYLPGYLIKIGVPLTAVVQVRINPISTRVPSSLFKATKRGESQSEILTEKSLRFWKVLQELRVNRISANDFKNTAFVVFCPPYWDTENLSGSSDKIYDELCYVMYDLQDLTRQHRHYLDNIEIINIPEETGKAGYLKYYHQLIDKIPLESVTIFTVLDNILETVCKSEQLYESGSRSSLSMAMTFNQSPKSTDDNHNLITSEKLVNKIFNTLCIKEANKKIFRSTYGEEYETHKDPIIINYGDFAKQTTFHLENCNLDNIIWSSLYCTPINNLWKNQHRPSGELEAKINFHVNVLMSCFDRQDVEITELNRLIHILACRKLYNNKSSLNRHDPPASTISDLKKNYLKRCVLAEPLPSTQTILGRSSTQSPSFPSITKSENVSFNNSWSDNPEEQRIKLLFDCPDISELVSATEIANLKLINHMIDNFDFFEEFTGVSSFQIMFDAFNKFNCIDYKYCEVTDCMLLMFHNSHDKDGIARKEWRCHLPTPLCLQDFFDYVLEEHYDWIQNEENIYHEQMVLKSQSVCEDVLKSAATKLCVENTEIDMELLMEGSLKYQEFGQIVEPNPETLETVVTSSKNTTMSPSTEVDSKSSRKPKSLTVKERQSFNKSTIESQTVIPNKPFLGYDLGDRRVEVIGKDATFFSRDGTRVSSYYTLTIPMNAEYIILNVVPGNSNTEFWFHKALGDNITSDILDICESFRIVTKDRMLINIKKQTYQVPLQAVPISSTGKPKEKDNSTEKNNNYLQIFDTESFYSLFITWPNGLIIESVYEVNSPVISYIKQYYVNLVAQLDEETRCINYNGNVIIFRPAGNIEVLQPNGSYINITKWHKRMVVSEVPEDIYSETNSDRSKKWKGKYKPKEKPSNTRAHNLSKLIFDDDKLTDIKPSTQYELIIEEYEFIETSGIQQKWIKDVAYDTKNLLVRTATDYCLREVFSRRMDGTNILLNEEGLQIVTFPNKTRIITNYIIEDNEIYPEWTEEEKKYFNMIKSNTDIRSEAAISQQSRLFKLSIGSSTSSVQKVLEDEMEEKPRRDGYISIQIIYIVEHPNFAAVTINKAEEKIYVDSPNGSSISVDSKNNYVMKLDHATSAKFDGDDVIINYEACRECQSNTRCKIKVKTDDKNSVTETHKNWLKMKDSFCKVIVVNEDGNIIDINHNADASFTKTLAEETLNTDYSDNVDGKVNESKTDIAVISHGKCQEMYLAKTIKFFVLRRDLGCAELVHRALLEDYKRACRWQPWCSINTYDTFGDYRSIVAVLSPIHLNESEKWIMDSKYTDKPKYLTYKHLKNDNGKGFYHWMRPYERFEPKPMKPDSVLPPSPPRAFVLRTLEQQWNKENRETLCGAKELLNVILRYRQVMEKDKDTILNVPIVDHRSEDMRRIDDNVQTLAHRIYEDLKLRLADNVERQAKITITTRTKPEMQNISVEDEVEEERPDGQTQKSLDEERDRIVKEFEAAQEMSANLQKYWRQRAEELKEEQFHRYLLGEDNVPPYFRNVLGGAIWWEINNTAGEAVTTAERSKMNCVTGEATVPRSDNI